MVDEARAGRKEQMSLCIKYSSGLKVKERFLKFIDCSGKTTAAELYFLINQELVDLKLSELHLVGPSYHGAAVMSGQIEATLGEAVGVIKDVIKTLEAMRSDNNYEHIHGKISDFAAQVDVTLKSLSSKRKKKVLVKLKDFVTDSTVGAAEGADSPNVVEY
ncbi:unnamed protein product [Phaedon cochleariae]|uniref:Uncharacterized protein n=1 Tax=Phaedon cochleariae TaxID=80249 RepID=A0A9N9SM18_PHACE|nr:unnamed protein product [Phaedon cochleariae]